MAGEPLDGPLEWEAAFFEVPVAPEALPSTQVTRNDGPLPVRAMRLGGGVRVLAEWPRASAGRYVVDVSAPGVAERIAVTVVPAKLNESAFATLVEDLQLRLPASIAIALSRLGALAGTELLPASESTLAQELERARRAIRGLPGRPGLAAVLTDVADDPHRTFTSTDVWVARERARRLHPARLPLLLASGGNLDADRRPTRVPELRVEHTVDVYENRLLRTFHDQVASRVRRLARVAGGDFASLMAELARARRRAAFLDDVTPPAHVPDRVTMVLLKRPSYRAALEGFVEYNRTAVVQLDEPALDAPLENVPRLYEHWGMLHVIEALLEAAVAAGFDCTGDTIRRRDPSGLFIRILAGGGTPVLSFRHADGREARLHVQRTYGSTGPLQSLSFPKRPDAALEINRPCEAAEVHIFDPKYKLRSERDAPVPDDIDAMHAYRDAIRDGEGRRVVKSAAILYPGAAASYGPGLEALTAHPDAGAALRSALVDRIGAALVTP